MAYTKEQIERILNDLARTINISDELFQAADDEYSALGEWIDKKTEEEGSHYVVYIYPQGSFALGTVIKPISDEDDYDLDLVCELRNGQSLSARQLKVDVVKPWLADYKKTKTDIEEKRRCWHVEYEDVPNFHMDVIPALKGECDTSATQIRITDKDIERTPIYEYQGSNPKGYVRWFFTKCLQHRVSGANVPITIYDMAKQENLRQNKNKTKLQKAVQILKRHRDVMFDDNPDVKPISIIITTLAGQLYDGEDTILDTLIGFVSKVEGYLQGSMKDGHYCIPNPSLEDEDFADKWKEHPERQLAFFSWIRQLKTDLNLETLISKDRVSMGNGIKRAFGATTGAVIFGVQGVNEANAVKAGTIKVNTTTGSLSETGTIPVPPSKHYGDIS